MKRLDCMHSCVVEYFDFVGTTLLESVARFIGRFQTEELVSCVCIARQGKVVQAVARAGREAERGP